MLSDRQRLDILSSLEYKRGISIERLGLPNGVLKKCLANKITSLAWILSLSEYEFLQYPGIGRITVNEIKNMLNEIGQELPKIFKVGEDLKCGERVRILRQNVIVKLR